MIVIIIEIQSHKQYNNKRIPKKNNTTNKKKSEIDNQNKQIIYECLIKWLNLEPETKLNRKKKNNENVSKKVEFGKQNQKLFRIIWKSIWK